mmetsp:Transcript_19538/g.45674  ORF Transcript_19538/g.45674 Transcript_19538/m.45674 type:complete len:517 (+) Transcript_19538:40-1590(+)
MAQPSHLQRAKAKKKSVQFFPSTKANDSSVFQPSKKKPNPFCSLRRTSKKIGQGRAQMDADTFTVHDLLLSPIFARLRSPEGADVGSCESGSVFHTPLFQRRYCWEEQHWRTLWSDVRSKVGATQDHTIGRLLFQPGDDPTQYVCVDGQQRLTTLLILLSSLLSVTSDKPLLERVLFRDVAALRNWAQQHRGRVDVAAVDVGIQHCRFIPTHYDRPAFLCAMLAALSGSSDPEVGGLLVSVGEEIAALDPPERADGAANGIRRVAQLYANLVQANVGPDSECPAEAMVDAILHRLSAVVLLLKDGSDAQEAFESFSRKSFFAKHVLGMHSDRAGVHLCSSDLIRNAVLAQLPSERQRGVYEEMWCPLEQLIVTRHRDYGQLHAAAAAAVAGVTTPGDSEFAANDAYATAVVMDRFFWSFVRGVWAPDDMEQHQEDSNSSSSCSSGGSSGYSSSSDYNSDSSAAGGRTSVGTAFPIFAAAFKRRCNRATEQEHLDPDSVVVNCISEMSVFARKWPST